MNGRLDKVEMTAKVTRIKNGVDSKACIQSGMPVKEVRHPEYLLTY